MVQIMFMTDAMDCNGLFERFVEGHEYLEVCLGFLDVFRLSS
jgi:hypothetical protein